MRTDTIALCWPNRIEAATLSSPTAFAAGLPLTNIQDPVFDHWARRLGTADLRISGTWTRPYLIGAVAVAAHNFSGSATWRVRVYSATASIGTDNNKLYDSGVQRVWPALYEFGEIPWGYDNWWARNASDEDRESFNPLVFAAFDPVIARAFTIDVSDPNNPDGYLQLGRILCADLWQPAYNFSFGSEEGYEFATDNDEAQDGTEYIERKSSKRTLDFTLDGMAEFDALGRSQALVRTVGTDLELLVIPDQEGGLYQTQKVFIGRLIKPNPLRNVNYDWRSQTHSIREKI